MKITRTSICALAGYLLVGPLLPLLAQGPPPPPPPKHRHHKHHTPPPPPPPPSAYQEGPPPSVVGDMARHAYLDGMKAAHQDLDGGFKPNPRRSSLFRNPPVPPPAWEDYRSAFGHGYQAGLDHYDRR
jgi:hypothetical protein